MLKARKKHWPDLKPAKNRSHKKNKTGEQADTNQFLDPEGPPPMLEFQVTTEDKNTASLTVEPDDPWKGAKDAKVLVVEYADLECGYCKRTAGQIKQLYDAYKDDVAFVFKHYPLDPSCNVGVKNKRHRSACLAALQSVHKSNDDFGTFMISLLKPTCPPHQ